MKKIWDDPPTVIKVTRQAVEFNVTKGTLDLLWPMVRDPALVHPALGKLVLAFEGWEDDARKMWQIHEVRLFVQTLDMEFPYWLYLADLSGDTLYTVAACVCRTEVRGADTVFSQEDVDSFLLRQGRAMKELFRQWSMPQEERLMRSEEVTQYLQPRILVV